MILLNYLYPLTSSHLAQIEASSRKRVKRVIELQCQVDVRVPFSSQVVALVDRTGLTSLELQSEELFINPPLLNFVAVPLFVELYGRCGYFPKMLRMRPLLHSKPSRYKLAEIINLQALYDEARERR